MVRRFALFALACFTSHGLARACDGAAQGAADGQVPYAPRSGGAYCEGTFALPVSASFSVLSVTIGSIGYASIDDRIYVSAPLSPRLSNLNLRARGRASNFGYQLDGSLVPPTPFRWDTRVALRPLGFSRNDFGVFGYRTSGARFTYVPVAVSRSPNASIATVVRVRFVAPEHLRGPIEYALSPTGAPVSIAWNILEASGANKGEVLELLFPSATLATPVTLRVRARPRRAPSQFARLQMDIAK